MLMWLYRSDDIWQKKLLMRHKNSKMKMMN